MMRRTGQWLVTVMALVVVGLAGTAASRSAEPPNTPATVSIQGATIEVRYHDAVIFAGRIANPEALARITPSATQSGNVVNQTVLFVAKPGAGPIELTGKVTGSIEAFPVESDRPNRHRAIVRHSVGLSHSRLNQSVYDRRSDWVLSVDDQPRTATRVEPVSATAQDRTFSLTSRGSEIVLRFRPRFYQRHRGLTYFEPWTYAIWPQPIVGWCSWFAFFDDITEQDVIRTTDTIARVLKPYGYEYVQIDDGYQQATGLPELWLNPNKKFPSGLKYLADYIRGKGLKPGIWTNATFSQTEYANAHPQWFVRDTSGQVAKGNWIDHPVDASAPGAIETLVRPIYRGLRSQGWEYYKLDALRHLRYEGYNTYRQHFDAKGLTPATAFRKYVKAVRDEIGHERPLLACWGVRPELVGMADACRIGTDGYSYAGLAQFNSFNNVVWRNDPDHIELSDTEAWRSTMVTTLTGSLFLLTDKPERYDTAYVEPAKRTAPVLMTVPGQLYDVDPSRSSELARVDHEVSGRDPKPFDASLTPTVDLFELEINRPFESWIVLGRTGSSTSVVAFDDLGLSPTVPHVVFEYWQKRYLGTHTQNFATGELPVRYNAQAFIVRPTQPNPQVLATSRHVTGGGVDLDDVRWSGQALTGRSRVVGGEPYEIYVTEPTGYAARAIQCSSGTALPVVRRGGFVTATCTPGIDGPLDWSVQFDRVGQQ